VATSYIGCLGSSTSSSMPKAPTNVHLLQGT